MEFRPLGLDEASRIEEIDRSEEVRTGYDVHEGRIRSRSVEWNVAGWARELDGGAQLEQRIASLRGRLESGNEGIGAYDDARLVGYIVLDPKLHDDVAQLAELFVSRSWRRRGLASRLCEQLIERARACGAKQLYVSSAPTESAVGFYRSQGFELAPEPDPELFHAEPDDIHMLRPL